MSYHCGEDRQTDIQTAIINSPPCCQRAPGSCCVPPASARHCPLCYTCGLDLRAHPPVGTGCVHRTPAGSSLSCLRLSRSRRQSWTEAPQSAPPTNTASANHGPRHSNLLLPQTQLQPIMDRDNGNLLHPQTQLQPIMDRDTEICSTHKHSFSCNNHNVTNITPSKHRNVRVSEADLTRHHQPSKASSLVCEQLLTMCSICHINTWRYYYYYLLQGQCFARMHTLAFVSLGSGLSVTSDTAANQILLKSKTEEFTTKAHFQPSFHQLTMSIL